jgi:hypothetical protein
MINTTTLISDVYAALPNLNPAGAADPITQMSSFMVNPQLFGSLIASITLTTVAVDAAPTDSIIPFTLGSILSSVQNSQGPWIVGPAISVPFAELTTNTLAQSAPVFTQYWG